MRSANITRNIPLLYIIGFFHSFIFFAPIIALYLEERLFSVLNVTIIFAIITLGQTLFEVPSGAIADKFGRKRTIVLASFMALMNIVLLAFSSAFIHFIIYAILASMTRALLSGTDESLLFDTLKEVHQEQRFKQVIGRHEAIANIGLSLASIIGGFLATISLQTPVIYSIIPFILAFLASLLLTEATYHKPISQTILGHMKKSTQLLVGNKQLLLLALASLLFEAFGEPIHQISQIFYEVNQIPLAYFGFIFGTIFALASLGSLISHHVSSLLGNRNTLIASTLFSMGGIFLATLTSGWVAVVFFVSGSLSYGIRNPIMSHMTNIEVSSTNRSTVLSLRNLATSIGYTVFAPMLGLLTDVMGVIVAFRIFASFYLILVLIQSFLEEKN